MNLIGFTILIEQITIFINPLCILILFLDRCLSLYDFTWKQGYGKLSRTKYHIAVLTIVCLSLNSHILFLNGYRTDPPNDSIRCYATRTNPNYIYPRWERVHLVAYNLCPFSIMFICNTYIIYVTIRSARIRTPATRHVSRHRQLSIMLMLITFTFVLLTLPSCIYFVFFRHRMSSIGQSRIHRYMVQICLGSVQFTAHAINFFLYCYSTKNFRNELRDFIEEIIMYLTKRSASSAVITANSTLANAKKPFLSRRRSQYQESTLENQQTGQQYALKDLETNVIHNE